jgi:glutamate racemase
LWCTHFPVLLPYFEKGFSGEIIDPSKEAAEKFGSYLEHHPEIKEKLTTWWSIGFLTTWNEFHFETVGEHIWWASIKAKHIEIN